MTESAIYTIGHSNHPIENFIALLQQHGISAVADVRSAPYSRRHPQYNREALQEQLKAHDIAYVFLGKELGARTADAQYHENGRVNYRLLARTPLFQSGIQRLQDGSKRWKIALMCAEKEPLNCHRTILIARELAQTGIRITHILATGQTEPHNITIARLLEQLGVDDQDMFATAEDLQEQAYAAQERRIASGR